MRPLELLLVIVCTCWLGVAAQTSSTQWGPSAVTVLDTFQQYSGFGSYVSVSADGSTLAVAATSASAVLVFSKTADGTTFDTSSFTVFDFPDISTFGASVAVEGDDLAVYAYDSKLRFFRRTSGVWNKTAITTVDMQDVIATYSIPMNTTGDLRYARAMTTDRIAFSLQDYAAAVMVLEKDALGNWNSTPAVVLKQSSTFGQWVAMAGDWLAVSFGAYQQIWMYKRTAAGWPQTPTQVLTFPTAQWDNSPLVAPFAMTTQYLAVVTWSSTSPNQVYTLVSGQWQFATNLTASSLGGNSGNVNFRGFITMNPNFIAIQDVSQGRIGFWAFNTSNQWGNEPTQSIRRYTWDTFFYLAMASSSNTMIGASSTNGGTAYVFRPHCPAGSGYTSSALSSCTSCQAGTYAKETDAFCLNCPSGTSSKTIAATDSSVCSLCGAATYAPAGSPACLPCAPGTASSLIGAQQCTSCGAGTYQPSNGQTSCSPCPPNFRNYAQGLSTASACDAPDETKVQLYALAVGFFSAVFTAAFGYFLKLVFPRIKLFVFSLLWKIDKEEMMDFKKTVMEGEVVLADDGKRFLKRKRERKNVHAVSSDMQSTTEMTSAGEVTVDGESNGHDTKPTTRDVLLKRVEENLEAGEKFMEALQFDVDLRRWRAAQIPVKNFMMIAGLWFVMAVSLAFLIYFSILLYREKNGTKNV